MSIANTLSLYIGRKRFLNRKLRNLHAKSAVISIASSFKLYLDPRDLYGPSFYVMYGGAAAFYHYEENLKSEIIQHFRADGVFVDVGANIGLISLFVSKFFPVAQIYSFEPGEVTHHCLDLSIAKNKIKNIELIKKGLSNQVSEGVSFFIDPTSTGGSSLVIDKNKDNSQRPIEKILLTTLDTFVNEKKIVPTLIKIDVEDAEEMVLEKAVETIEKYHPVFIVESNNKKIIENPNLFETIFKDYKVREIGTVDFVNISELQKLAAANANKKRIFTDYIFIPR
ncbi:MAG: FkbM family methyltransferase [Bacteriovorax sp.]|nr:FkbM family methyltransferase [Bacteriovorax sp.]